MNESLVIGLRDICMTAAEQQALMNYMNAYVDQVRFIFILVGILIASIAWGTYIYFTYYYGMD